METATVTGIVSNIKESPANYGKNRYSVCVDGQWYDQFAKSFPAREGDTVEMFTENDPTNSWNPKIVRVKRIDGGTAMPATSTPTAVKAPVGPSDRELAIMRQNAATNANSMLQHNEESYSLQDLIETAEVLVAYYRGDLTSADLVSLTDDTDSTTEGIRATFAEAVGE